MIIDLDSKANINLTHSNKQHSINNILPFFLLYLCYSALIMLTSSSIILLLSL